MINICIFSQILITFECYVLNIKGYPGLLRLLLTHYLKNKSCFKCFKIFRKANVINKETRKIKRII